LPRLVQRVDGRRDNGTPCRPTPLGCTRSPSLLDFPGGPGQRRVASAIRGVPLISRGRGSSKRRPHVLSPAITARRRWAAGVPVSLRFVEPASLCGCLGTYAAPTRSALASLLCASHLRCSHATHLFASSVSPTHSTRLVAAPSRPPFLIPSSTSRYVQLLQPVVVTGQCLPARPLDTPHDRLRLEGILR
jgi:hypothetical protein